MELHVQNLQLIKTSIVKLIGVFATIFFAISFVMMVTGVFGFILAALVFVIGFWALFFTRKFEFYCTKIIHVNDQTITVDNTKIHWSDVAWYRLEMNKTPAFQWVFSDGLNRISLVRHYDDQSLDWRKLENLLRLKLNELEVPSKSSVDSLGWKLISWALLSGNLLIPLIMLLMRRPFEDYKWCVFYLLFSLAFVVVPIDIDRHRKRRKVPYGD